MENRLLEEMVIEDIQQFSDDNDWYKLKWEDQDFETKEMRAIPFWESKGIKLDYVG